MKSMFTLQMQDCVAVVGLEQDINQVVRVDGGTGVGDRDVSSSRWRSSWTNV